MNGPAINGRAHALTPLVHDAPMTEASFLQRVLDQHGANAWANLRGLMQVLALPPLRDPSTKEWDRRPAARVEVELGVFEHVHEIRLDVANFLVQLIRGTQIWIVEPGKLGAWNMDGYGSRILPTAEPPKGAEQ